MRAPQTPTVPPPTLGLIGGGQLARMTAHAAARLGCIVAILERHEDAPAAGVAHLGLVGDWNSTADLLRLADVSDVLTLENEFADAEALAAVERRGHVLRPGSGTMKIVQDKLWQKQALADEGIALAPFADAPSPADVLRAAEAFGWPLVLKRRRNGYDGKGNYTLRSARDLEAGWTALGGDANPLFVEGWFPFERELAVIIARGLDGGTAVYPVVETIQENHICRIVKFPAGVPSHVSEQAADLAARAVRAVAGVGVFGVELFHAADGSVAVNELAPRVHNSGHYTMEACACSQFENHVRAVMGWPLGSPRPRTAAAVMVNLLGHANGPGHPAGLEKALAVPEVALHLYGKSVSAPGRKMGHVTALGETVEEAMGRARQAADALRFGDGHSPGGA